MATGWKAYRLHELGFVGRGKSRHRPRNDPSLYGGHYPFFQTADIKSAVLRLKDFTQTYNEKGLAQSKMWPKGTLCITIAANIAETAILAIPACFPDSVIGFIADPKKTDPIFIKYYIDLLKSQMQQVSHGTTQDNLSLDKLLRFDFIVPEVQVQQKIASILSAYDDLIENNLRRIKILEEMARTIYREWFVKFRFPGHEKVRMVDSPLGKIPEGWELSELSSLCTLIKEPYREELHASFPLIDLARIPQKTLLASEVGSPKELSTSRIVFWPDDVLFGAIRPYLHKVILAPITGVTNVSVFVLRAREEILKPYVAILLSMDETIRWADQYSTGTKMPVIKWDVFQQMKVLIPKREVIHRFYSIIWPMMQLIKNTFIRNSNLRRTRNLLLPKLISGEIDVSDLHIKIPEIERS